MHKFIIYTDGSCHTQYKLGAWVSMILYGDVRSEISGTCQNTTHNRMELMAVIESVDYIKNHFEIIDKIEIFTDSQYVAEIPLRREKMIKNKFKVLSGKTIQNHDLVLKLISQLEQHDIEFIKVKAHQKAGKDENINRQVDKLVRKILRDMVKQVALNPIP